MLRSEPKELVTSKLCAEQPHGTEYVDVLRLTNYAYCTERKLRLALTLLAPL